MFAERLQRARRSAGMSMRALADAVGVSAASIKKYEHGEAMPASPKLIRMADVLGVRTEYFFRPIKVQLEGIEYRKRSKTPQKLLDRINGHVMEQAERWVELLDLYPDSDRPVAAFALPSGLPRKITRLDQIEKVAERVREGWSLGTGAIPDLIDILESKGIMIIMTGADGSHPVDGLAGRIGKMPLVVVSLHQPGDRQRFTMAHELGHLVLHGRLDPSLDEEKACHRFAGAFLLPAQTLRQRFGKHRHAIELRELAILKQDFGLSMLAIVMRARQCGVIAEALQKQCFIAFSKRGWRRKEPGDACPREQTSFFGQLVYRALGEGYIGESKAAELLSMSLARFHKDRKLEAADESVHQ